MRAWLTRWRLALRLARRDLLKHKARAIIALVMVTLPVFGVVAADVLIQTTEVSRSEGVDRALGTTATAAIEISAEGTSVRQSLDPNHSWAAGAPLSRPTTVEDIEQVLGHRTMLPFSTDDNALVETSHGRDVVRADQVDGGAPLAEGLYRLVRGRWPSRPGEVVVNQALRDRGIGDTLSVRARDRAETKVQVVGTIVDATTRTGLVAVGLPGWLPGANATARGTAGGGWLIDGPPVTEAQLRQLNQLGVFVTDRRMITHPDEYADPTDDSSGSGETAQVFALIVVMALIEVVLLAGPAFAVGARKQQRSLALLVASGGTPAQARRVIIGGGLLLGVTAGVVGVVGGVAAAWALQPVVQRFSGEWLGPFDVPWPHLAAVAAFGLISALIACLVPAWIAARQNVVAVLAGRRGDAKPKRAFPVLGLVLFGIGVMMAVGGARGHGSLTVAWSAVFCVLGTVLLVPVVVSWVARVAAHFPLPVRFAARDAVRHRTRTTPAVAAVAATVAGVVALGIGNASDEKKNRETYQPSLVIGDAAVVAQPFDEFGDPTGVRTDWAAVESTVRAQVPDARITPVVGVERQQSAETWVQVEFHHPGQRDDIPISPMGWTNALGSDVLVSDGARLPAMITEAAPAAGGALAAGKAVVFGSEASDLDLDAVTITTQAESSQHAKDRTSVTVPAVVVVLPDAGLSPAQAVLPPALARRAGLPVSTVGLDLTQPGLSKSDEKDLNAALQDLPTPASITVERGYQASSDAVIIQLVLAALAAILMLGGTLTAMFLALSDARPDLATLAAVGAPPRTRRSVAAAYTFVVSFVGAVLGMVVGFVPGLAAVWPLTVESYAGGRGPFIAIPWLLIAVVVVGLPVLTAAIVALATRSRLPMVSRLN